MVNFSSGSAVPATRIVEFCCKTMWSEKIFGRVMSAWTVVVNQINIRKMKRKRAGKIPIRDYQSFCLGSKAEGDSGEYPEHVILSEDAHFLQRVKWRSRKRDFVARWVWFMAFLAEFKPIDTWSLGQL